MTLTTGLFGLAAACALTIMTAVPASAAMPAQINGPHAKLPCTTCHADAMSSAPAKETCFQCHGSYAKLAERTAKMTPNPHMNHRGEQNCSNCHSLHGKSRFECNDCHNFTIRMKGE